MLDRKPPLQIYLEFCHNLALLLIGLKLCGVISTSWLGVTSPIWGTMLVRMFWQYVEKVKYESERRARRTE